MKGYGLDARIVETAMLDANRYYAKAIELIGSGRLDWAAHAMRCAAICEQVARSNCIGMA